MRYDTFKNIPSEQVRKQLLKSFQNKSLMVIYPAGVSELENYLIDWKQRSEIKKIILHASNKKKLQPILEDQGKDLIILDLIQDPYKLAGGLLLTTYCEIHHIPYLQPQMFLRMLDFSHFLHLHRILQENNLKGIDMYRLSDTSKDEITKNLIGHYVEKRHVKDFNAAIKPQPYLLTEEVFNQELKNLTNQDTWIYEAITEPILTTSMLIYKNIGYTTEETIPTEIQNLHSYLVKEFIDGIYHVQVQYQIKDNNVRIYSFKTFLDFDALRCLQKLDISEELMPLDIYVAAFMQKNN